VSEIALSQSPRLRRSPYYEATVAAGAKAFTVYNHMLLPTSYSTALEECRALTESVAMWDVAAERQVEIAGPDAERLKRAPQPTPRPERPTRRATAGRPEARRAQVSLARTSATMAGRTSWRSPRTA
jgi:hypothetical protein